MMKVYRGYGRERTGLFPSSSRKQPQPSIRPYVVAGVKTRPLDETRKIHRSENFPGCVYVYRTLSIVSCSH
jgi:hypothetical protein